MNIINYIKRLFLFFIPLFIILIVIAITGYSKQNGHLNEIPNQEDITTLIVGDSHPEVSFNPLLVKSTVNCAQSAESYFFTYYKLLYLLEKYPNLKTVVLGFSYNNLNSFWDDYLTEIPKTTEMIKRYSHFLDLYGFKILAEKNPVGLAYNLFITYSNPVKWEKNVQDVDHFGGYKQLTSSNVHRQNTKEGIYSTFFINGRLRELSDVQQDYFMRIIELLNNRNINILLVNTPYTGDYVKQIPKPFIEKYQSVALSIKDRNKVKIVDWSSFLLPDSCFYDATHLNKDGAIILSQKLDFVIDSIEILN